MKVGAMTILTIAILIAPVFVLRSDKQLITTIEVHGNNTASKEEIEKVVRTNLAGSFLGIFPKASVLLYKDNQIETDLIESLPKLKSVSVGLIGAKAIEVVVTERVASALYCQDVEDPSNPSKCFFIDDTGFIYSDSPTFSQGVYTVYSSTPKLTTPIRNQFFSAEEFVKLERFVKNLKSFNLLPKVVVKNGSEYSATLSNGPELKWRGNQNLENLYVDLGSFLNASKFKQSELAKILYIDLRFDNKVFYKFKNE